MTARETHYRGWIIEYVPKPIPASCGVDWSYRHADYDGPEDRRCGHAASLNDAKNEIDMVEGEGEPDAWKLTRDLAEVRERLGREYGNEEMRDYYRRSAFELRCLLARVEASATPSTLPEGDR